MKCIIVHSEAELELWQAVERLTVGKIDLLKKRIVTDSYAKTRRMQRRKNRGKV
ncbi:hypothetical protein KKE26_12530 [bacterium]|nr:hypothetical protein [bacterium]